MRNLLARTLAVVIAVTAFGQRPTTPPSNETQNGGVAYGWPQYASVTVFISSALGAPGSASYNAYAQGFTNTQNAYSSQGVTFSFQGYDAANGPPTLSTSQVYLTAGTFPPNPDGTQTYGSNNWSGYFSGPTGMDVVTTAVVTVDPTYLTTTNGMTFATSHESSHDFFLGDCPTCEPTTIMTYSVNPNTASYDSPQPNDQTASYEYSLSYE